VAASYLADPGTGVVVGVALGVGLAFTCPSPAGGAGGLLLGSWQSAPITTPPLISMSPTVIKIISFMFIY
jgi:hypothetical protein